MIGCGSPHGQQLTEENPNITADFQKTACLSFCLQPPTKNANVYSSFLPIYLEVGQKNKVSVVERTSGWVLLSLT